MIVDTAYRSSNGDDWQVERTSDGTITVVHRANPGSGGTVTRMSIEDFLERDGQSPQAQAVRAILARGNTWSSS